jgi:hypothetical protein
MITWHARFYELRDTAAAALQIASIICQRIRNSLSGKSQ